MIDAAGSKAAYPGPNRLFKGVADGLGPLGKGIVSAGITREEDLLFETKNEISQLINELEKKDENET